MKGGVILMVVALIATTAAACAPVHPSETQAAPSQTLPGGEWFKQKGCTDCHSITAYRMWNLTAQGPDLSEAVEDVPRRFGRSLEEFLHAPTGTMAMVLSSRIPLTVEERNLAVAKLHEAYRRHQGLPEGMKPSSSH